MLSPRIRVHRSYHSRSGEQPLEVDRARSTGWLVRVPPACPLATKAIRSFQRESKRHAATLLRPFSDGVPR
jgi:hypothetical protein